MKARILKPEEEEKWDKFIHSHPLASVHQHSLWGHFQRSIDTRGAYWIITLEKDKKIVGGTVLIRHKMGNNMTWLYSARGPLLDYNSKNIYDQMEALLTPIKEIAKQEKAVFYRIDPPLKKEDYKTAPKLKGFYSSPHGFQPDHTLIIDLTKSKEEILKEMKQKGRYNINLAEKKGVNIRKADPKDPHNFVEDLEKFHEILHETTVRDKFYGHRKNFYKSMLEILHNEKSVKETPDADLYLAEYNGEIIAGIIVTFFKDTAIYYYGASSNEHREVMAPYLLQWTAIQDAKSRGCKYYDFLGIAPSNAKNHPWQGVTQFKKKFGGQEVSYLHAREYPLKTLRYLAYRIYKTLR